MRSVSGLRLGPIAGACGVVALVGLLMGGCGGATAFEFLGGTPYPYVGQSGTTGAGTTGRTSGQPTTSGGFTNPCNETQARKLVRISMRNQSQDYIHYFLVMIAFVNSEDYPTGGVCAADIPLYTSFGYTSVPAGSAQEFGNYCIPGPALVYFHRGGQFRGAGGTGGAGLASGLAPAQGSTPSFDSFFTSAGAPVPVPDIILFHNPGNTAQGQALKVSRNIPSPCSTAVQTAGDPACQQDSFYYVDENDRIAGSTALGTGSGRRVPAEIQGTGCQCLGLSEGWQELAPSGQSASGAACNQFFRGGRIEYVFVRDDRDPPYPQLLVRVTDAGGARAQDFDPRSGIR